MVQRRGPPLRRLWRARLMAGYDNSIFGNLPPRKRAAAAARLDAPPQPTLARQPGRSQLLDASAPRVGRRDRGPARGGIGWLQRLHRAGRPGRAAGRRCRTPRPREPRHGPGEPGPAAARSPERPRRAVAWATRRGTGAAPKDRQAETATRRPPPVRQPRPLRRAGPTPGVSSRLAPPDKG